MKTIKIILITFILFLTACGNDKSASKLETDKGDKTEIKALKRKEKKEEPKKNTIVTVDAIIEGKKFTLDAIDFKKSSDVIYLNDGLQFRFIDVRGYEFLVNFHSSEIYKKAPITFSQQVSALDVKEQARTQIKRSRLEFVVPTVQRLESDSKIFYDGNVFLEKFTDDKIVVSFKGNGFTRNFSPSSPTFEDKLFPMEGKIIVENFNIHDGRF